MANWINYTDLFPSEEQAVIQEIQNIAADQFGYTLFESFRLNFSSIPFGDFSSSEYADTFYSELSTWLVGIANQSTDWNEFKASIDSRAHDYIDLIIAEYSGSTISDFATQEDSTRITTLKGIEGFMTEYRTMLYNYMSELPLPITITSQPTSTTVCEGEAASLSVTATGEGISYQWKLNGSNIAGANTSTLSFSETVTEDQGSYECVLSSDDGYVITTNSVTLTVNVLVYITQQPTSKEIDWNTNYTLEVEATSDTTIQYQWRKNGLAISGATSSAYTLQNVKTAAAGQYDCILTDDCSQIISNKATIEVSSFDSKIGVVYGKVEKSSEAPISGLTVKVIDKKPGSNKVLGSVITDGQGEYYLEYLTSALLDQQTQVANLVVQLFEDGASEPTVVSAMIEKASLKEEVNFSTDAFTEVDSEFDRLFNYLDNALDSGVILGDLDTEDIKLLSNKSFSQEMIMAFINAGALASEISAVSQESFYGMIRKGLPSTADALAKLSDAELKKALLTAGDSEIISALDDASAQSIADDINGEAPAIILQSDTNPFKTAFEKVTLTEEKKLNVIQKYLEDPRGATDVLEESTLTPEEVSSIQRIFTLTELDSTNSDLIDVLDEKVGLSTEDTQLEDLVPYTIAQWEALIDDSDETLLSIPPRFNGTEAEKKTAYAKELRNAVELKAPTKVLAHRMNADGSFDSADFDQFFTDHPDFELGTEQISKFLETNPLIYEDYSEQTGATEEEKASKLREVQNKLEGVQRLYRLVPPTDRYDTMKPLINDDINSAHKIVKLGESAFKAAYGDSMGADNAANIYKNAANINAQVMHVVVSHTNTPGPLILSTTGDAGATGSIPGIPDLETIFGSLDYCECTHCRSVYSAAAYLVDLLNFLTPAPGTSEDNLQEALLNRRGEIKRLFLHCDNTNTPLPYIDIVNEILENYIYVNYLNLTAAGDPTNETRYYQTEADAATLKATPQNIIKEVYDDALKTAVHPIDLPFNLWFEQAKSYLGKSNVDLGDFIAAAPSINRQKVISAAASLGISVEQLNIITATPPHNYTPEELYNVSSTTELKTSVAAFIKKAGVSYEELLELMDSKFINPLKKVIYFPSDGSCRLNGMTIGEPETFADPDPLSGFNPTELQLFNRFVRLHKLTGWSFKDLDLIINSLNYGVLNDNTIINIYYASKLKEHLDVSIEEMVTWWSDFDIRTFIDENLFDKLFQDTSVNAEETAIPEYNDMIDFTGRSFLEEDIKPLVLGALNLSAFDLDVILAEGLIPDVANVENFSMLYRISSFTKAVDISVKEYFEKRTVIEKDGIKITADTTPESTQDFLDTLDLLHSIPFTEEEISYLKSGNNAHSLAPKEEDITEFLTQLRTDYQRVDIDFSETAVDLEFETSVLIDDLIPDPDILNDIINGAVSALSNSDPDVQQEVDDLFNGPLYKLTGSSAEMNAFKSDLDAVALEPTAGDTDKDRVEKRRRFVYSFLQRYNHVKTDFKSATTEKLALFFDLPAELTAELYNIDVPVINQDTQTSELIGFDQFLFDLVFLTSKNDITPTSFADQYKAIRRLAKVATIAKALDTTTEELNYLIDKLPLSYPSMESLPVEGEADVTFSTLKPILSFRELDGSVFSEDVTLIEFLNQQHDLNEEGSLNRTELLAEATGWRESDITVLIGANGFDFEATPDVYLEVNWIKQLHTLISLMNNARLDASTLVNLSLDDPDADTAFAIRNFLSSGMNRKQWLKIAADIHDNLREQKRDAMVAFLIANEENFNDTIDVYNYFLIDTQMGTCQLTSRIKQAISAIQLFVQRIGLNLEGDLYLTADEMEEWKWRKNYRVWEANRKVFLYPENYTLPEVRTNKSKLYNDFEEALTQEEVDFEVAEKAYQKYLEEFKNIANLEVMQMVNDEEKDELHVFAKSSSDPIKIYHRTLKNRTIWSGWESVPVDMADGILPIIHKGKLMVCWLDKRDKVEDPGSQTIDPASTDTITVSAPDKKLEIRLAWTTKTSDGWEAKKLTRSFRYYYDDDIKNITVYPSRNHYGELIIGFRKFTGTPSGNVLNEAIYDDSSIFLWKNRYYLDTFVEYTDSVILNDSEISDYIIISSEQLLLGNLGSDTFSITDQKLFLQNLDQFKWVNSIESVTLNSSTVPLGDGDISNLILDQFKTYRTNLSILLTNMGSGTNDLKLIREMSLLVTPLSKNYLKEFSQNQSPFFIKIENRTYIIFSYQKEHSRFNNIPMNHNDHLIKIN